jgi:hypothetical protein
VRVIGSWSALAALVVGVCLAWTGCGSGDDSEDAAMTTTVPKGFVKGTPQELATDLAAALATTDSERNCKELQRINDRSAVDFPCAVPRELRTSMKKFKVDDVETYGSAAVVNYTSGAAPDGASMLMYVQHPQRRWTLGRFGLLNGRDETVDKADARAGYDKALGAYLKAVRERDCKLYSDYASALDDSATVECREDFKSTIELANLLKKNRDTEPDYLGGSDRYGFYTLDLKRPKPTPLVITTMRGSMQDLRPYRVLSVGPAPLPR